MFFHKKQKKLWDSDSNICCYLCFYSSEENENGKVECSHFGEKEKSECCKKFLYDPTKRRPKELPPMPRFQPKDFEL